MVRMHVIVSRKVGRNAKTNAAIHSLASTKLAARIAKVQMDLTQGVASRRMTKRKKRLKLKNEASNSFSGKQAHLVPMVVVDSHSESIQRVALGVREPTALTTKIAINALQTKMCASRSETCSCRRKMSLEVCRPSDLKVC